MAKEEIRIEEQVKEVCERDAFRRRLVRLGYSLSEEDIESAFATFKDAALIRLEDDLGYS